MLGLLVYLQASWNVRSFEQPSSPSLIASSFQILLSRIVLLCRRLRFLQYITSWGNGFFCLDNFGTCEAKSLSLFSNVTNGRTCLVRRCMSDLRFPVFCFLALLPTLLCDGSVFASKCLI